MPCAKSSSILRHGDKTAIMILIPSLFTDRLIVNKCVSEEMKI